MELKGRRVEFFKDVEHKEKEGEGIFLQFGVDFEEFDEGIGNHTLVLMLMDDGTIHGEPPGFVRFMNVSALPVEKEIALRQLADENSNPKMPGIAIEMSQKIMQILDS